MSEQVNDSDDATACLFNFEYCLRQIMGMQFTTHVDFEKQSLEILKKFNVKKKLYKMIKEIVLDKSLEYKFRILGENNQIECADQKRLSIGHVTRGNFSQITGKG